MRWGWLVLAATLASAALGQAPAGTASVSGVVVDAVSGRPVARAQVMASGSTSQMSGSGPDGSFTLRGLAAGGLMVMAMHPLYPQGDAPLFVELEIRDGEQKSDVKVQLMPGAVVSGTVRNDLGEPMENCSIQMRRTDGSGPDWVSATLGQTDDRGVYRMAGLMAGEFVVQAQCAGWLPQRRPYSRQQSQPDTVQVYPVRFYPKATSAELATKIRLKAGEVREGVDIEVEPENASRLTLELTGVPAGPSTTAVIRTGTVASAGITATMARRGDGVPMSEILPRGVYDLEVTSRNERFEITAYARQRIEWKGAEPETITVPMREPLTIRGSVRWLEGPPAKPVPAPSRPGRDVNPPPDSRLRLELQGNQGGASGRVEQDGSFELPGVLPGRYQIFLPPGEVVTVRWGTQSVMAGQIEVSESDAGPMLIEAAWKRHPVQIDFDPQGVEERDVVFALVRRAGGRAPFVPHPLRLPGSWSRMAGAGGVQPLQLVAGEYEVCGVVSSLGESQRFWLQVIARVQAGSIECAERFKVDGQTPAKVRIVPLRAEKLLEKK